MGCGVVRNSAATELPQTHGETPVTEHETNLRDLAAMFAMAALLIRNKYNDFPHEEAFSQANQFMKQRAKENEDAHRSD